MIAAIVLAAGGSSRMRGQVKPLLRFGSLPLIRIVVDAAVAGGCRPVIVVLGAHAEEVRVEIDGLPVEVVVHPDWSRGMSGSIRAGITHLISSRRNARGALLLACDQPRITPAVIGRLLEAFDGREGRRVACEYAGTVGVPALFDRTLFPALRALRGDRGAKPLLLKEPEKLVRVPWPEGADNLNTPEDYAALRRCGADDTTL